ncbi:hypothetical protein [Clostridium culturomicium]|uniref:hypothetical protein n=1 Tax=Clostridium culturomicium TaxID=1499683 RepID=UPI00058AFEF3|nr:hypothetical protein [Clostridium culturomicium]
MKYLSNLDLNKNELQNARIQNLATAPASPVSGQVYFNSADSRFYGWNGSGWIDLGQVLNGASIVSLINGSSSLIDDDNLSVAVNDAVTKKHSHTNSTILNAMEQAFTTALKNKLDGIPSNATKVEKSNTNGNIKINGTETPIYSHPGSGTNPHNTTKSDVGLGNVENKSSATIRDELTTSNINKALGFTPKKIIQGVESARPTATGSMIIYIATDTKKIWLDTGANTWLQVGGQDTIAWGSVTGKPSTFTPPTASPTVLGGIKVGNNLSIDADGTLNANDNPTSYIVKQEKFIATAGQTVFNLTKGKYRPGLGTLSIFLNGVKIANTVLEETSQTSFTLKTGLSEGDYLLAEYVELINVTPYPIHANEHLPGGSDPIPEATTSKAGLMSYSDKSKLNGVASGANNYVHPSGDGNIHVPATGTTNNGKVLKAGATAGKVTWDNVTWAEITGKPSTFTPSAHKHSPADINQDASNRFVTDSEKSIWNGKAAGNHNHGLASLSEKSYNSLTDKPSLGTAASKNTGVASGQVPLIGSDGKLDPTIMPAIAISDTFVANSQTAMLALTAEVGDICIRTDLNKSFILKIAGASILANWQELLTPSDKVQSVNGMTGAVTLNKSHVGLGNVDNVKQASKSEFDTHHGDNTRHITTAERSTWNARTRKYSVDIGNGSLTTIPVTHNLGSMDVTITIREKASPYNVVFADIQFVDNNKFNILFGTAPTSNQYRVTVVG